MTTITESIQLSVINCGNCGGTYAINERYREKQYEIGGSWHCPYCDCGWGYSNSSENAKLKKELEEKARELTASKCETLREKQLREAVESEKQKVEKKLRRSQNGVCTCCNRSFSNLQRHMATKHPQVK